MPISNCFVLFGLHWPFFHYRGGEFGAWRWHELQYRFTCVPLEVEARSTEQRLS